MHQGNSQSVLDAARWRPTTSEENNKLAFLQQLEV
jgi:hypothetical protein